MWTSAPWTVRLWFVWAFGLLALSGLLLPRIIAFVDFSERAPFSLLGIFMMLELAVVLFGITVAMQRKRIGHRLAIAIAALPAPILGGLPPALFGMHPAAANGWYAITVPLGMLISIALIAGLLRPSARAWFTED
ncbi:MAG TPA: hypothetical protein VHK63_06820 [Candidatus Limnocylindria bacterium]|nr:hypothetical protein [Candidatus Limnocylindria bacterium]